MVREDGKRSRAEIFGDSILPGLGSQEGWHMDQEKRQTKALEKIAKGYGDRRIVQEVARRESSISDKRVYDLPSAYVPNEVVKGFSNMVNTQQETTDAVRQSAEVIYGGLMDVENRVGEVVDAAYSIDGHVQEGNIFLAEANALAMQANEKLDLVNYNLETIDRTIDIQTEKINDSIHGISSDKKELDELIEIEGIEEVDIIAMALKGILNKTTFQEYFSSFSARKRTVISQVINYDPNFQKVLYDEMRSTTDKDKIRSIKLQIEGEIQFIKDLRRAMTEPLRVDILQKLARHGKMDRFVQDEAGENIREVRTDTYGVNQSLREMLAIMEDHWGDATMLEENQKIQIEQASELLAIQNQSLKNQERRLVNQEKSLVTQNLLLIHKEFEQRRDIKHLENEENMILNQEMQNQLQYATFIQQGEIGKSLIKNAETQLILQYGVLKELGIVGDNIGEGFRDVSQNLNIIQDTLVKTLEFTEWTNVRVLATLNKINESIENQAKNWLNLRFEERIQKITPMILVGKFNAAIKALERAQEDDPSDPRSYFLKGISYMYTGDTEKAEIELLDANTYSDMMIRRGSPQEEVDKITSQINTYLARLYFKLSQKEGANFEGKMKQAIESAEEAYERDKNISTGTDFARYLSIYGDLPEAYEVIKEVFRSFPEIVCTLLEDEDFVPFVEQVKKDKWKELHELRLQMLKRLNK